MRGNCKAGTAWAGRRQCGRRGCPLSFRAALASAQVVAQPRSCCACSAMESTKEMALREVDVTLMRSMSSHCPCCPLCPAHASHPGGGRWLAGHRRLARHQRAGKHLSRRLDGCMCLLCWLASMREVFCAGSCRPACTCVVMLAHILPWSISWTEQCGAARHRHCLRRGLGPAGRPVPVSFACSFWTFGAWCCAKLR